MIDGLNRVLDLAIAEFRLEGGTMIVPGHGRICRLGRRGVLPRHGDDHPRPRPGHGQEGDDARAGEGGEADGRLRHALRRDDRPWTTDMFIEAVYKSSRAAGRTLRARRRHRRDDDDKGSGVMSRGHSARFCALVLGVSLSWHATPFAAQRGPRPPAGAARSGGADRYHRPLGVARHRRLALADGHAAEGRHPLPAGERRGPQAAEQWDPAKDEAAGEACKAYGAGGIMHLPGRLRITWENDTTLKLETDTGQQTRLFTSAVAQPPAGEPRGRASRSPRGNCPAAAVADAAAARRGGVRRARVRRMRVTTTRMRPGYYRRNGVPYGANATMTEWFTT